MVYRRNKGSHMPAGFSAQVAGDYFELVEHKYGKLTTENLVKQAERDGQAGPVGMCFTWDEDEALHKLHLHEARLLINSVEVVIKDEDGKPAARVPAYVNIRDDKGGGEYLDINSIMKDPKLRARILARATRELEAWQRRYEEFEETREVLELWCKKHPHTYKTRAFEQLPPMKKGAAQMGHTAAARRRPVIAAG